jgi:hypothetical protein
LSRIVKLKVISWIATRHLFYAFRESGLKDYARALGLRLPVIILVTLSYFFWIHGMRSFISIRDIFIYSPLIMVITTLPITPAGLGTTQALCIEFFSPYLQSTLISSGALTPAEIIFAGSIAWLVGNSILKILFATYCLQKKSRRLFAYPHLF